MICTDFFESPGLDCCNNTMKTGTDCLCLCSICKFGVRKDAVQKWGGNMAEEFRRLNRELMYHGTIVDFYKDTIEVPNGNVVEWDFIGHKGAAAVLPVREDGKLLMVRQYRNALDRYTLEIPAGGLNGADEPTRDAAGRDLVEAPGERSNELEWLITIRTTVAFCNEKIDIYVAKNLIKSHQHLDEDEFINVEAYSVEELSRMILEGKIEDSKTISAIMSYKDKYCRK